MTNRKTRSVLLWIVQGLLAALFLFAGAMKLSEKMEAQEADTAEEEAGEPPEGAQTEESKA